MHITGVAGDGSKQAMGNLDAPFEGPLTLFWVKND